MGRSSWRYAIFQSRLCLCRHKGVSKDGANKSEAPDPDPVRDTSGKLLSTKNTYYILPVNPWSGGGLELTKTKNMACPLDVVQTGDDNTRHSRGIFSSKSQ
ncbi:unnamed protein product [Fraxinus pennsylvanica]|uniref:Uncharacterized protein n=1 Tax=Fraxinus pennsylvanica TaxID=56036 RepID=A0AAD1Z2H9_9LAMI|nr:unnamed protein product [Fraxinus pennsylvanica]